MLVIHPKDRTTSMLSVLYAGMDARVIVDDCSTKEIGHLLHRASASERIMLLGHGSDKGLFYRHDDTKEDFDRIIVSHTHAYHLRRHSGNIIAVWCNADAFARAEGLHGLFSGMIITELSEAQLYNIATTQDELNRENIKLASRLRALLDENIPLHQIPQRLLEMDDVATPLTNFNYQNFYYL